MAAIESVLETQLKDWKEREERYKMLFSPAVLSSREFLREKLAHFDKMRATVMASPVRQDRLALQALQLERRALERQVYPNIFIRMLARLASLMIFRNKITVAEKQNEDNSSQIKAAMIKAGLGNYYNQVEQQMKQGNREISLPVSYYVNERERMDLQLNFKKDAAGLYQFENYRATLSNEAEKGKQKQHIFSTGDTAFSADKAYNLLAGRSVMDVNTGAWHQLDFNDKDADGNFRIKNFPQNYGFNLAEALQKMNAKEDPQQLMMQLRNGQQVEVTLSIGNKEKHFLIEANAHRKGLSIYESGGQKISLEELKAGGKETKTARVRSLVPQTQFPSARLNGKSIRN